MILYPVNNISLDGWKQIYVTDAQWPLSTATRSGGGLLLISGYNSAIT